MPSLVGLAGAFLLAWEAMPTEWWTDYQQEAQPAFNALRAGHVGLFLQHSPAYGGSLILRAPFVYASHLLGGGSLAAFRAAAVPCVLATVMLGVYLHGRVQSRAGAYLALGLAAFNPLTMRALGIGHPEELLGAVLCAGAVFCALADRPGWAGLLLGLAAANKAWAVMAVGPVMLALDRGRLRAMLTASAVAGVVLAPLVLHGSAAVHDAALASSSSGGIFHPWQLWWFLGSSAHAVTAGVGPPAGFRIGPGWVSTFSHPLIAVIAVPASIAFWRARGRRADALGLLALLLLLRCVLDPWNISYYHLPFLLALLSWEVHTRRRAPVAASAVTLALWLTFRSAPAFLSPDAQSVSYLVWALPLVAALALRVYAPRRFAAIAEPLAAGMRRRMPALAGAFS
ncbi:MAG: hypothetical protein JWN32_2645 [Solirubrobacterales bacterium]|nr:hypothetical protein [Solirubrobacterales bacterium]